MNKKNVIVIGGSGFIGTHLLRELLKDITIGKILVLDKVPPEFINENIHYSFCDITETIDIDINSFEICFHLAALAKEPGYEWSEYFKVNYLGTKNIIAFCNRNRIKTIIFTSSMMVYKAGETRFGEDDLTAPDTAYGISKVMAELILKEWLTSCPNNKLKIIRPGVVFGKGEKGNYTRLYYALKKNMFFYIGRKNTIKSSIYVKDLVRFLIYATNDDNINSTYNIVFPYPLTIEEICNTILCVYHWRRIVPTVPFKLALLISYFFQLLSVLGIKTEIHPRRIEKLYYSTNISAFGAFQKNFKLEYNLKEALEDWKMDCYPSDLY